jgi:predicted deacylase
MADGAATRLPIIVLRGRTDRPRVVAIAGVHGDEHDGSAGLLDLADWLDPATIEGTLVVVPVANPPAFRAARRWNPADGIDMNRIFPGESDGSITHRLARVLVDEIVTGADYVVTVHGWTAGWLTVPYVEYVSSDATTNAARAGAVAFGTEWLLPLAAQPGRLATVVAELGIPGCEAEVGGEGITLPERAAIARRGVEGIMRVMGLLPGNPDGDGSTHDVIRHRVVTPVGGALRRAPEARVGGTVTAGATIASVSSLTGEPILDLEAPVSGVLSLLRHALPVEPGDLVAAVFADARPSARSGRPRPSRHDRSGP